MRFVRMSAMALPISKNPQFQNESTAQFRRRTSAVPNLILVRFDCSTAGKQL